MLLNRAWQPGPTLQTPPRLPAQHHVNRRFARQHELDLPLQQLRSAGDRQSGHFLAQRLAGAVRVQRRLLLGRGELNSGGTGKASILADGVEALLGAIYLEHGTETAHAAILRLFGELLDTAPSLGAGLDWKSSLQELTAARGLGVPMYLVTSIGPDHDKQFTATVVVMDTEYGTGVGRTKKEAELKAASAAWMKVASTMPASKA